MEEHEVVSEHKAEEIATRVAQNEMEDNDQRFVTERKLNEFDYVKVADLDWEVRRHCDVITPDNIYEHMEDCLHDKYLEADEFTAQLDESITNAMFYYEINRIEVMHPELFSDYKAGLIRTAEREKKEKEEKEAKEALASLPSLPPLPGPPFVSKEDSSSDSVTK